MTEPTEVICGIWNFKSSYRQLRTFLLVCFFVSSEECIKRRRVCEKIFIELFEDIPQNPECLATFPRMLEDIPRNVWRQYLESLAKIPGILGGIPWNVYGHSPEYNISFIPRVPCIPFPVPLLSSLCRCQLSRGLMKNVCIVVFILKLLNILVYWKQQAWF